MPSWRPPAISAAARLPRTTAGAARRTAPARSLVIPDTGRGFVDPVGPRQLDPGGRQLAPGEVEKVRRELVGYQQFAALTEQIVEVNEAICEARPAAAPAAGDPPGPQQPDGEKGGSGHGSRRRRPPR